MTTKEKRSFIVSELTDLDPNGAWGFLEGVDIENDSISHILKGCEECLSTFRDEGSDDSDEWKIIKGVIDELKVLA